MKRDKNNSLFRGFLQVNQAYNPDKITILPLDNISRKPGRP
ncbi:hypothetical protein [Psychroflexus tropicus]|nr:hypothetical protein [Psychroflexus tropicus]